MNKIVKHIKTKTDTPLCNCGCSCAEYLDDVWPTRQSDNACFTCMRIYRIMRKAMRTAWTRERLARLPESVVKLIEGEVKAMYEKRRDDNK